MKKQSLTERFQQLAGLKSSVNENLADESMSNRDIMALEGLLKKYSREKINITLDILGADDKFNLNPPIQGPQFKQNN